MLVGTYTTRGRRRRRRPRWPSGWRQSGAPVFSMLHYMPRLNQQYCLKLLLFLSWKTMMGCDNLTMLNRFGTYVPYGLKFRHILFLLLLEWILELFSLSIWPTSSKMSNFNYFRQILILTQDVSTTSGWEHFHCFDLPNRPVLPLSDKFEGALTKAGRINGFLLAAVR